MHNVCVSCTMCETWVVCNVRLGRSLRMRQCLPRSHSFGTNDTYIMSSLKWACSWKVCTMFMCQHSVIQCSYRGVDHWKNFAWDFKIFGFPERFQDFSQDFQRFQPEAYEISRSEQPLVYFIEPFSLLILRLTDLSFFFGGGGAALEITVGPVLI